MAISFLDYTKKEVFKFLSKHFSSHVLLYHSCFDELPDLLKNHIHNVRPDEMYEQLKWYKRNFDIVPLQEWVEAKNRSGLVSVTFDDAYRSVFTQGLPVLEALNIPATIFVIAGTLREKTLWRDQIRILEALGLTKQLTEKLNRDFGTSFTHQDFYLQSKDPVFSKELSNASIDQILSEFLAKRTDGSIQMNYCVAHESELINHPLLMYGNHSFHHYNFSTLSIAEQQKDLKNSYKIVKKAAGSSFINYFSLPFGGHDAYNNDTLKILNDLDTKAMLLNNTSLNHYQKLEIKEGIKFIERYMLPSNFDEVEQNLISMSHRLYRKK